MNIWNDNFDYDKIIKMFCAREIKRNLSYNFNDLN